MEGKKEWQGKGKWKKRKRFKERKSGRGLQVEVRKEMQRIGRLKGRKNWRG